MTDNYRYSDFDVLVQDNRRSRGCYNMQSMLLLTVISMPILVFCGVYLLILTTDQKIIYPKTKNQFQVPELWLNRLKIYANHSITYRIIDRNNYLNAVRQPEGLSDDFKLVCYYNFPPDDQRIGLSPEQIDPDLCTHINIGFTSIGDNKLYLTTSQLRTLRNLVLLKSKNPKLRILLSVGGAGNASGFPGMVLNHTNRKTFIRSVLELVKNEQIDGIDLDWEFPNENQSGDESQRVHFTQLLEEFRKTIDKQQSKYRFLLTVAVAAPPEIVDASYDVTYMNDYVDYVNLMSYDCHFYTKITPFTGLNAPLYKSDSDGGYFAWMNINYTANYWISKGMDRRKIVVGLPTYGHSFRLVNMHNNGLYAPARGYGKLGTDGFADYNEICKFLEMNQISPIFDMEAKSPYATKSVEWFSFDNELSLSYKAEFIRDKQFGGAMIYSLNTDDFSGQCNIDKRVKPTTFPLTRRVAEILGPNYSIL